MNFFSHITSTLTIHFNKSSEQASIPNSGCLKSNSHNSTLGSKHQFNLDSTGVWSTEIASPTFATARSQHTMFSRIGSDYMYLMLGCVETPSGVEYGDVQRMKLSGIDYRIILIQ